MAMLGQTMYKQLTNVMSIQTISLGSTELILVKKQTESIVSSWQETC